MKKYCHKIILFYFLIHIVLSWIYRWYVNVRFIHKISVPTGFLSQDTTKFNLSVYIPTSSASLIIFLFLAVYVSSPTESFEQTVKERFSAQSRPNEVRKLLNGNVVSSASCGHSLCGNKTNVGCPFILVRILDRVFLQTVTTSDFENQY